MLTRTQLILLTAMATLGGSFAGLLVVGLLAGDVTLAMINLGVIVALFSSVFVIGGSEKPSKPVVDQKTEGTYFSVDWQHKFKIGECNPSVISKNESVFNNDKDWSYNLNSRRAGDIHVGGELNPEFRTSLSQMIAAQKESGTA